MPMSHPTRRQVGSGQRVAATSVPAMTAETPREEKSLGRPRTRRTGRIERLISRARPGIACLPGPSPGLSPAAAQRLAERHAEARALARGVDVALRLRVLFHAQGLGAGEPDALAAVLDREDGHLDLGPGGVFLAEVGALGQSHLRVRDEADLAGADAQEHAEGLDA